MADLITVDDAKLWLNIPLADTTRDDILQSLVSAASEAAIAVMSYDPTQCVHTVLANGCGGAALPLNHYPIQSVSSVTINPASGAPPLPAADYVFDHTMIYLRTGRFPLGKRNIAVTYTAGLASVPASMALAVKYTVKAFWDARLTDMNASAESFAGVGGAGFWPSGPGAVPPSALSLLERYFNPVRV